MADTHPNPVTKLGETVADAIDWIEETFSDPALSREMRGDLGLNDATPTGPLPTSDELRKRLRHPDGQPVDIDKAAFEATVAEISSALALLYAFFEPLILPEAGDPDFNGPKTAWDAVNVVTRIGASESIRVRWPLVHSAARALGFVGGLGQGEEVEAVNVFRAVDLLKGPSGVPSDTIDPSAAELVINWVGLAAALFGAIEEDDKGLPVRIRSEYGWQEYDFTDWGLSTTPVADITARLALSVDVSTFPHVEGAAPNSTLTLTPIIGDDPRIPFQLGIALGGGFAYTQGRFSASVEVPAPLTILWRPPWDFTFPGLGQRLDAVAAFGDADAKALPLGDSDGAHAIVETVRLRISLGPVSSARLELTGVDLSLALKDADPFIASLSRDLKTSFDVALVYDSSGLHLDGGPGVGGPPAGSSPHLMQDASAGAPGLEADLPVRATNFGPFGLKNAHVKLGPGPTHQSRIELTAGVSVVLGPVGVTLDRIGMSIDIDSGEGRATPPNLGLVDLATGFKAPTGAGLTIDAKLIKGGGFLALDEQKGEYTGCLTLTFGRLTVNAIGLLDTKAPEPARWSLLLLLYAEFRQSPWQLGMGFTITAVGGIVGLQHGVSTDQLRAGLGTGAYDDVLFPAHPATDAPRIFGELRTLFPVQAGALTVGPVLEINWGTPPLVVARIGVLVQFGGVFGAGAFRVTRLTIIGTVTATAPPKSLGGPQILQLVQLTADLLGDYDVESGLLAIDARLRDSKLGGVEFSGSLIVRIGMGSNPAFAIAAGGFHPAFTDLPPALPARIDRLGLQWRIGSSIVLSLQAYAAITASSWQLGARFALTAKIGPVDIDGALGFDAIAYDDGRFSVDIDGHVKIGWHGHTLMAVSIHVVLDRNQAQVWHAAGSAKFSILWWDKEVHFEVTWGSEQSLPPPPAVDAQALLRAALADPAAWSAQVPAATDAFVTFADPPARTDGVARVVAHPLGTLAVTQRVAPLGLALDHVDGAPVKSAGRALALGPVRLGGAQAATAPTTQMFARARFQELSETQRLTEKTFEALPAGASITPAGETAPVGTSVEFEFKTVALAPDGAPPPAPVTGFHSDPQWHIRQGRAAQSELRRERRLARGGLSASITVRPPAVAIVGEADLAAGPVLSPAEARSATLARQRAGVGQFVIERHELAV